MLAFVTGMILSLFTTAQKTQPTLDKPASDAFVISRMVEKYHVQPRPLNKDLSAALYNKLMDELDDSHFFFTTDDLHQLSAYQYRLDDEIRYSRTDFLKLLTG